MDGLVHLGLKICFKTFYFFLLMIAQGKVKKDKEGSLRTQEVFKTSLNGLKFTFVGKTCIRCLQDNLTVTKWKRTQKSFRKTSSRLLIKITT